MDPPTYNEARLHPVLSGRPAVSPPPSYDASLSSPPTPPPTYGEAVTQDPFPILTPPRGPPAETRPRSHNVTVHPTTHVGVHRPQDPGRPQAVTSQPRSGAGVQASHLRDAPAVVRCPHCQERVTTRVAFVPGKAAWCMCLLLVLMGLFCGFCLIPFMVRGLQDAHHSCPECGKLIHIYTR